MFIYVFMTLCLFYAILYEYSFHLIDFIFLIKNYNYLIKNFEMQLSYDSKIDFILPFSFISSVFLFFIELSYFPLSAFFNYLFYYHFFISS